MLSEEKEVLEYIKEAFSLHSQQLYKQSIEMLYKALDMDNDNIEILFQLGENYYLMHNYERAIGYLQQVLDKEKNHLESLRLMYQIYLNENDYEKALDYSKKLYEIEKASDNIIKIIKCLGKLNKTDELKNYKLSDDYDDNVICEIANAFYENRDFSSAKEILNNCKNTSDENLKLLLGKIYFEENELDKAKAIFSEFAPTTDNAQILNYKGLFALEEMNFVEAIKNFSKAVSINKNNPVYFYNLGNAYFFNGWKKESQDAYAKAIYLAPNNMDYRYSLCYLYYESEQYDKCKKEVDAILLTEKKHLPARVLKALLLNREKEYGKAKEILEENMELDSEDNFTMISLSKTYMLLDMCDKAEKIALKVIENNPDNLDYAADLADIYIKQKEYDKAFELAENTIKLNPNYVYGYVLCAKIAYLKNDYDVAKEYSQKTLLLDMNCSYGYYYLALVRIEEKDYEEAIECMKRAITYDASNPLYYAEMSKIYKAKNDYKTALEYISEATNIDNSTKYKVLYEEIAALKRKSK